jgi:hypothetical protein
MHEYPLHDVDARPLAVPFEYEFLTDYVTETRRPTVRRANWQAVLQLLPCGTGIAGLAPVGMKSYGYVARAKDGTHYVQPSEVRLPARELLALRFTFNGIVFYVE